MSRPAQRGLPTSATLAERSSRRGCATCPDFPSPGILFKDITPLLADPAAFGDVDRAPWRTRRGGSVDVVAGIEARGFIFGAALAHELGVGFVPVRKAGKLPGEPRSV